MATKARDNLTERRRKLALVIGIGEYKNINQLSNPENDATDMTSALKRIGFTVTMNLHLTRAEMKHVLVDFENSIQPDDMVLFYFAGHGIQWEDQNYLLPKDIPTTLGENLNRIAVKAQEILNDLTDRKPFVTIFLLDCCRAYHQRNPNLDARSPNPNHCESDGFKPMHKAGSLIAFACAPGTIAIEGHGRRNGLFTAHLLKHIATPNEDIQLILRDVRRGVVKDSNNQQTPFLSDGLLEKNICLNGHSRYALHNLIEIPDNDLELHEKIGNGAFGTVYRATWLSTHYTVAVKKLLLNHLVNDVEKVFLHELKLLHNFRGPHIVTFLGACMEEGKYALVMEYMPLGSLYKILHMDKLELEWTERLLIALQAAKGVNYLHQLPEPILHRDIKSLNFLLERTYEGYGVKVCDFGVARLRNETTRLTGFTSKTTATLPWTAPEILKLQGHTEKSDIYSLGIVYWELATCKIPYDGYEDTVVRQFVLAGERLQEPLENTPPAFRTVIEQCWAHNPCDRPNGTKLIQMIEQCIPVKVTEECVSRPPLPCNGHPCVICGRCSDWMYTGHPNDWEWIRKIREWDDITTERWRNGTYHNNFTLKNGANCNRSALYKTSLLVRLVTLSTFDGSTLIRHLCSCGSTKQGK